MVSSTPHLGLALLMAWAPVGAHADDLFQGDFSYRNGQWTLERCNAARTRYMLTLPLAAAEQLAQARAAQGEALQGGVFGVALAEGARWQLQVRTIATLAPGSCQLDALF